MGNAFPAVFVSFSQPLGMLLAAGFCWGWQCLCSLWLSLVAQLNTWGCWGVCWYVTT